jgi:hypothetical protein
MIDAKVGVGPTLGFIDAERAATYTMQECRLANCNAGFYSIPQRLRLRHSVVELMPSRAAASSRVAESESTRSM